MTTSFEQFQMSDQLRNKMKRVTNRSTLRTSLYLAAAEGPKPQNTVAAVQDVILVYRDEVRFDGAYMIWRFEEASDSVLVVDHVNLLSNDTGVYDPAPRTIIDGLPYFASDGVETSSDDAVTGRGRFHPAPGAVEFWMRFNGISGLRVPGPPGFATVPDHPSLDISGDIDIRWFGNLDSYATGGFQTLAGKYAGSTQWSYLFDIHPSGTRMRLAFSTNGTPGGEVAAISTAFPVDHSGLRTTRVAASGVTSFYYSIDGGLTWVLISSSVLSAGSSIFVGSAPLEIGATLAGATNFAPGIVERVEVRNGIDGTVVLDVRFTDADQGWTVGDTGGATGVEETGKTVTISATAEIGSSIAGPEIIARITADPDVSDEELTVTLNVNGTLTVDVYDILPTPTLLRTVTSLGTVDNNQWRYIVVNDTGSDLSIYLDGEAS